MLTVYRASAGSGKTYKLTLEYLMLALKGSTNDDNYKQILAVTFTNKATDEMKRRIIEKLDILAKDVNKSEYADELCQRLKIDSQTLQEKAQRVLYRLLHDFSAFNISTIDRFFQQTTRAFIREIGLQGGYNLELDDGRVLSEAIDRMLFDLEENKGDNTLLNWLIRYSTDKVENGQYWDIREDIGKLATELFKESYKRHSDTLLALSKDKSILQNLQKSLQEKRAPFEKYCKEIGEEACQIIRKHNLEFKDFKGGANSPFYDFDRWKKGEIREPKATLTALAGSVKDWYTKTASPDIKQRIEDAYSDGLNDCICSVILAFDKPYTEYLTAVETSRYLYTLGILSDISHHIEMYAREHNILLLSDTNELLSKIIDGSDTPFIYEKIGTHISNYMVDEFQDTSKLQWNNLLPLFKESLDMGNSNLIVGDVKQSIYRWRNSDWTLLDSGIGNNLSNYKISNETLDTNWRSSRNVVNFNNTFFLHTTKRLQAQFNTMLENSPINKNERLSTQIESAYKDIYQKLPPHKTKQDGHVRVTFVEPGKGEKWKELVLESLPTLLVELQQQGVELRDIAILVRNHKEAAMIAQKLIACKTSNQYPEYRFDLVSDEALYINSSPMVRFIVGMLKYLQDPNNETAKALVAFEYNKMTNNSELSDAIVNYFDKRRSETAIFHSTFADEIKQLYHLSLFEICEKITTLFPHYNKSEGVFIQAFQDLALNYMSRYASDLNSFLAWWDERGSSKTISLPDELDAIRILTVHKSKGLEFKATILPFVDWEIDDTKHEKIVWADTPEKFNTPYPVVPIRYNSKLAKTDHAAYYFEEKMHNYIDCINLAYVAFTRAKESLIIYTTKRKASSKKSSEDFVTLSDILYYSVTQNSLPTEQPEVVELGMHFDSTENRFEIGEIAPPKTKEGVPAKNNYEASYTTEEIGNRLHLRLYSKGFFHDRKERTYGNLMHDMLSRIVLPSDIANVVEEAHRAGQLDADETTTVTKKLQACIGSPIASRWFSPHVKVLNETAILQPTGSLYRPDRVVFTADGVEIIDYKFGHLKPTSHQRQVSRYMKLVEQMGYTSVRGYLWYIELDEVVELPATSC